MSGANALRGETELRVGERAFVLRPSFAALVAAEAELGPLFALVERAADGRLAEGCDKQLATCRDRFANAINFRGEAHLPGNDLLTRYPGG